MFPLLADVLHAPIIGLAILVGVGLYLRAVARAGVPVGRASLGAVMVAVGGVLGGRVYWLIEQGIPLGWSALAAPGYRHPGILIGVLVGALVSHRLLLAQASLPRLLDLGAPAIAFAFALGRIGCLVGGCCFGLRSHLPWAVRFPDGSPAARLHHFRSWVPDDVSGSLPVHPLQLYFTLLALLVGITLLWLGRRKTYDGQVFLAFIALHETGKFFLEALREPDLGTAPNWVPVMSLGAGLVAGGALVVIHLVRRRTWTSGRRMVVHG